MLAGLDVHTGQVFASTPLTTGIKPFMDLAGQVMARPEYKNAPRVFAIVDNGSDHRGKAAIDRLARAHPNAIMIHTPVHASWLNQIEIFSVIQKKVVTPNDFASLEELSATLLAFTRPVQPDRPAVQLEIHRSRPARPHGPHQPPQAASPSWTNRNRRPPDTPDELTVPTT